MRKPMLLIVILIFFIFQAVYSTVPLVLSSLVAAGSLRNYNWLFPAAFLAGLGLDFLCMNNPYISSLFFVGIVFVIFLYRRRFEVKNVYFTGALAFLSSVLYLELLGVNGIFLHSAAASVAAAALFLFIKRLEYSYED